MVYYYEGSKNKLDKLLQSTVNGSQQQLQDYHVWKVWSLQLFFITFVQKSLIK
jgi:hypothetical protein